ncbi:MAG: N-6 DNA methylase, partial [Rhodospirillales bacterium]|nr:N-6 DNA methylase [Rhodospirillales bacterium]
EQIGSVYETMMGFRLETAAGPSVAVKSPKKHGAPSVVNLETLLAEPSRSRGRFVQQATDRKLTDRVLKAVAAATSLEKLHAALDPVVDRNTTPDIAVAGSLILQPNEERRRSGSHYTPRALTGPIVRRTLEPILARLREAGGGSAPRPEAVLDLKVCDPAMGSGAFLVEACRQLGDALIEAWKVHGGRPEIPPDEDETIFARRLVAQKCLYGVDRNPLAVDLAKLSLWLVTLAKDHPLTFVDHALRAGDSLVGLSREQIERLDWKTIPSDAPTEEGSDTAFSRRQVQRMHRKGTEQYIFAVQEVRKAVSRVGELRRQIRESGEEVADATRRDLWDSARDVMSAVRLFGDVIVATFFAESKPGLRERERRGRATDVLGGRTEEHRSWIEDLRTGNPPLVPFHWEIEFPEVFERENPGFDAFMGNPPFAGKNTVNAANPRGYLDWLKQAHPESHGNSDLVAHFFRRGFHLLREGGVLGLIATNTIAQGDTRSTGLRWICENGGVIYDATRRYKWPGQAAVVVSVIHIGRGDIPGGKRLDGTPVPKITAFLFDQGGNENPVTLWANAGRTFVGSYVLGMGFTFDDTDKKGVASSLGEMRRLIAADPRNTEVIFPYIGGEEVNTSPTHAHHRYVINFRYVPRCRDDLGTHWSDAEDEQRRAWLRAGIVPLDYPDPVAADWPELLGIVERTVKPARAHLTNNAVGRQRAAFWWRYGSSAKDLYATISNIDRVLARSRYSHHNAVTFLPSGMVFSDSIIVFPFSSYSAFCGLHSTPHELWTRFFGSSMKDDLRYTPSDCFETFPFPNRWESCTDLEATGKAYYDHRATLMVANDEGLTKTYNRFHEPYERDPNIQKLRDLHAAMDRAVLDAYGWTDIPTDCDFFPLHPDDENDAAENTGRPKPRKFRYRWPDEIQNEVLARLLDLNTHRAVQEREAADQRRS